MFTKFFNYLGRLQDKIVDSKFVQSKLLLDYNMEEYLKYLSANSDEANEEEYAYQLKTYHKTLMFSIAYSILTVGILISISNILPVWLGLPLVMFTMWFLPILFAKISWAIIIKYTAHLRAHDLVVAFRLLPEFIEQPEENLVPVSRSDKTEYTH